jgi:hypothetical protein
MKHCIINTKLVNYVICVIYNHLKINYDIHNMLIFLYYSLIFSTMQMRLQTQEPLEANFVNDTIKCDFFKTGEFNTKSI